MFTDLANGYIDMNTTIDGVISQRQTEEGPQGEKKGDATPESSTFVLSPAVP